MMKPNPQLKAALATLSQIPGFSPADARTVEALIVGNPYLLEQFNRAAASGALKGFELEADAWNEASYRAGMIRLSPASLHPEPPLKFNPMVLTFTLGHEITHANDPKLDRAFAEFLRSVDAIAASPSKVHDYTGVITKFLDAKRDGEGLASIGGFNAVHAALVAKGVAPTPDAMYFACPYDMGFFLDDPGPRGGPRRWDPGLRFAPDGSLQAVPSNVNLLNHRYFHRGDHAAGVDYLHNYAAYPISYVLFTDRSAAKAAGRPQGRVVIDFGFLGLSAGELAEAGVYIYPPQRIHERPADPSPSHVIGPRPVSHAEPESPLQAQARDAVARLDAMLGRVPDSASERLATAAAALARVEGLHRIDHVLLNDPTPTARAGERVFVVEGEPDAVHRRVATMDMREALDPATPSRLAERTAAAAPCIAEPAVAPAPVPARA